ncbi:MAG: hypothetical protein WDW38_005840 [Sanguina aurantia]
MVAKVGFAAPAWKGQAVVDGDIKEISSADYAGKYLVLLFYPLDFTFVCPTEIVAFSDRAEEFRAIGAEVVGGGLGGCNFPLLADITKQVSRDYEVLIESGDDAGIALRGLFIVSPTGILRQITVNDLPVGRSVDETVRLVKAFQFVDVHGEVCPANWQPGAATMKPDPTKSLEYFSKQ